MLAADDLEDTADPPRASRAAGRYAALSIGSTDEIPRIERAYYHAHELRHAHFTLARLIDGLTTNPHRKAHRRAAVATALRRIVAMREAAIHLANYLNAAEMLLRTEQEQEQENEKP